MKRQASLALEQPYPYALAAVALWSTVATAFALSLRYLSIIELILYASLASTAALAALVTLQRGWLTVWQALRARPWHALGLGALNPCLYYLVLFTAYERLPAQEAQALNYTWAITLALLSVPLLGHRLRARDLVAAAICYLGALTIATRGEPLSLRFGDTLGVAAALGSTLIWALYWIANTRDPRPPVVGMFLNFAAAVPILITLAWLVGIPPPSWQGVSGAVYVGLFEMGVTFVLWLAALRRTTNTSRVTNLIFLAPVFSLVLIATVLGEAIRSYTLVGLALILTGLAYQQGLIRLNRRR